MSVAATYEVRPVARLDFWTPATSREMWTLGVYFFAILAAGDILNVRLGVELMTLVVFVAAVCISRRPIQFLRDWWFFLLGLLMWNLSGPVAAMSPFRFHPHLDFMIDLDRILLFGRDPVVVVQNALAHPGHIGPLDVFTAVVYNLHLPEPYIAGYLLWRLNRAAYLRFCAAVLVLLVVGFVTYIVFPAVPPWLAAQQYGKVPGVFNGFGPVLKWHPMPFHGTPIMYALNLSGDAIAAFPSQHAALPMVELLTFWSVVGRSVRAALLGWVLLVLFTIIYLGEHWVTDALAGYAYSAVIVAAISRLCVDPGLRGSAITPRRERSEGRPPA